MTLFYSLATQVLLNENVPQESIYVVVSIFAACFVTTVLLAAVAIIAILLFFKKLNKTRNTTISSNQDCQMYEEINPIKKTDDYQLTQNSAYEKVFQLQQKGTA